MGKNFGNSAVSAVSYWSTLSHAARLQEPKSVWLGVSAPCLVRPWGRHAPNTGDEPARSLAGRPCQTAGHPQRAHLASRDTKTWRVALPSGPALSGYKSLIDCLPRRSFGSTSIVTL